MTSALPDAEPPALRHTPEDMTVTADAAVTLSALQDTLAKARQWLPLDPPNPGLTLREILDRNESGPRRFGYGTIRDYVIGLKVRPGDGQIVKSGGQVVKNVAGYDLQKLFIGGGGTLGAIQEVTFKLRPLPDCERFVAQEWAPAGLPHFAKCGSVESAIEAVVASELQPGVFDLHRAANSKLRLVLGFDGTKDDVDWQLALAAQLGFQEPASLDYDRSFRADATSLRKHSILPSKLIESLRALGGESFVARAGNGIIYHRANLAPLPPNLPAHLLRRIKDAFDPKHLLPELPT